MGRKSPYVRRDAGVQRAQDESGSPDGKFLYASNRLHDSIAMVSISATGRLAFRGEEWTRGDHSRAFNFNFDSLGHKRRKVLKTKFVCGFAVKPFDPPLAFANRSRAGSY
jgi:hypothetical protein